VTPLDDRRQRAREAYRDALSRIETVPSTPAVEEAIETATRVKVTDDIIAAGVHAVAAGPAASPRYRNAIIAAFIAAGFEVED
jgi:hypothetical protein